MSDVQKVERLERLRQRMELREKHEQQGVKAAPLPCDCCGQPSWNGSGIAAAASNPAEARLLIARFNAEKATGPVCKSCFFDPQAAERALAALLANQ